MARVYEDKTVTFRQLDEMACRIAQALTDQGIGPGDHVGIFLRNHWSYFPSLIYTLEEVTDVAVIGIPGDKWGEIIHAIVVCRDDAGLTEDDVISACQAKLASFQTPRSVEFRPQLPRNPSGKLLKRVLRAEFLVAWMDFEKTAPHQSTKSTASR